MDVEQDRVWPIPQRDDEWEAFETECTRRQRAQMMKEERERAPRTHPRNNDERDSFERECVRRQRAKDEVGNRENAAKRRSKKEGPSNSRTYSLGY